jgi:16S rRNA U516 pseudouridylate synthase RsuA-like enzyme
MLLREYLQSKYSISRRAFTQLVDEHTIFLDGKIIDSYKQEITPGNVLKIDDPKYRIEEKIQIAQQEKTDSVIVLFNKPMGYVVSKSDPYNQTIYELLPAEYQ